MANRRRHVSFGLTRLSYTVRSTTKPVPGAGAASTRGGASAGLSSRLTLLASLVGVAIAAEPYVAILETLIRYAFRTHPDASSSALGLKEG